MTKVTYESWVSSLVENLATALNLGGWHIHISYTKKREQGSGCETYASITVNQDYQWANLEFYPLAKTDFAKKDIKRLVEAVVHELIHIFLDPFQDWMHPHLSKTTEDLFTSTVEQQTQKLTRAFVPLLPKNLIPPLK